MLTYASACRLERKREMIFRGLKDGYAQTAKILMSQQGLWPEAEALAGATPQQASKLSNARKTE